MEADMAFTLPDLPYSHDALAVEELLVVILLQVTFQELTQEIKI